MQIIKSSARRLSRNRTTGVSLEGSTVRSDGSANRKLYGRDLTARQIVREGKVGVPNSGRELIALLDKRSPKKRVRPRLPEGVGGRSSSLRRLIATACWLESRSECAI